MKARILRLFDVARLRLFVLQMFALVLMGTISAISRPAEKAQDSGVPDETMGQAEPRTLRFGIYGDTRDGHAMHRKVLALLLRQKPEFVLQTGDLVHSGDSASLWRLYDEITGAARKAVPFYPARGNHDLGGPGYEARVATPFTSGNKRFHSFDKAGCHFICLAVDEATPYAPDSPQYAWLRKDLEHARTAHPAHIFVYFHVPPYSIGSHGSDLSVRKVLCPLFTRYGVTAVFNGHDHNYYRTRRDGVTYIVTGGGGAPLYPAMPGRGAIAGDRYESVNHVLMCEVKDRQVTITALRANGTLLDRFTISK